MSRSRIRGSAWAAIAVWLAVSAIACSDDPTTPVPPRVTEPITSSASDGLVDVSLSYWFVSSQGREWIELSVVARNEAGTALKYADWLGLLLRDGDGREYPYRFAQPTRPIGDPASWPVGGVINSPDWMALGVSRTLEPGRYELLARVVYFTESWQRRTVEAGAEIDLPLELGSEP